MKTHLLLIRTISPDTTPSPKPSLIADLVDAVLKVPGLRVTSVEVNLVSESEAVTRRVRNLEPKQPHPEAHVFSQDNDKTDGICVCGEPLNHAIHKIATAKPGKETHRFSDPLCVGICNVCGCANEIGDHY